MEDISVQQGDSEINPVPHDGDSNSTQSQGDSEINPVPHDGDSNSTQSQDSAPPATSRPLLFGYDRSQCLIKGQLFAISVMGGMIAGYCLELGGNVVNMTESLSIFGVYREMLMTTTTNYCSFYDNNIDTFIACLYLAAAVAILPSFIFSKLYGRWLVVYIGFGLVLVGSVLSTIKNLPILFIGRIICGIGVGCILQVLPVYISESAPSDYANLLTTIFHHSYNLGFAIASTMNYFVAPSHSGLRLCSGLSGALALASLMLFATAPESPHYFIEMKDIGRAENAFKKTRGRLIVAEFDKLVSESEGIYGSLVDPFRVQYLPYLFIACVREIFMQLIGVFALNFFSPVFLNFVSVSTPAYFVSSIGVAYTYFIMVIVGGILVGRYKRRVVLRTSASVMILTLFMIFGLLRIDDYNVVFLEADVAIVISVALFFYVGGYAVISGPLGWFSVPLPRRANSIGSALTLIISMLLLFSMAYFAVPSICLYKEYVVLLFAMHAVAMEAFISYLVPETRDLSEEEMNVKAWGTHRLWKKCI